MKIDFEVSEISKTEIDAATGRLKRDVETEKIETIIDNIGGEYGISENEAAAVLHAEKFKSKDISGVNKKSLQSVPFQLAMQKMGSSHLQALQTNFDEETVRAVLDEGRGLNTLTAEEINNIRYVKNKKLHRWALNTPGGKEMLNWSETTTP